MKTKILYGALFLNMALLLLSFSEQPVKLFYRYKAFFACTHTDSVHIVKTDFDQMMNLPICAKDSTGKVMAIESFEITYAERGLYQDSTGLPIIFTDYTITECKGDSIPKAWRDNFLEAGHKGDTVSFDRIVVRGEDRKPYFCKRIKCVIR